LTAEAPTPEEERATAAERICHTFIYAAVKIQFDLLARGEPARDTLDLAHDLMHVVVALGLTSDEMHAAMDRAVNKTLEAGRVTLLQRHAGMN
jgi:hypothetical protein